MLKSFVAGIVVIVGLAVFIAVKDERAAQKIAQHTAYLNKGAASAVTDENHPQENVENWDSIGWSGFFRWPNGTAAWAIILTLLAVAWQSIETQKSAKAAARGIELQEGSQRAWVVIRSGMEDGYTPSPHEEPRFSWTIKNYGKTPAQILETQCRYELIETKTFVASELPNPPDYPLPIPLNGAILVPKDPMYHFALLEDRRDRVRVLQSLDDRHIWALEGETLWLLAYGYVKYRDGISDQVRESHFIANYVWPKPGRQPWEVGFRPVIGASSEYTKCT